ncbi:MAG: fenitrothion hydrolase [Solirubrobacteraceae bacterium]|nr:fenitrothion hydrolase [Solirubrobacteraceae bacterium]
MLLLGLSTAMVAGVLASPEPASAHGLSGGRQIPIPEWLFGWAAAIVLVVSFVGLSVLWPRPRLEAMARGRSVAVPAALRRTGRVLLGVLGVLLYGTTVWAGLTGTQDARTNLAPTMVFVALWVGIPVLSVFVGNVWRAISPWRAIADLARWLVRRTGASAPRPIAWPVRLGMWPAAGVLLAFGWLELVAADRDDPSLIGLVALVYGVTMLVGTGVFGTTFLDRADGFGRYFHIASTLAPVFWRDGRVGLRVPGSGLGELRPARGLPAVVLVLIGTTTFDGLSGGEAWTSDGSLGPMLEDLFASLGLGATGAATAASTTGLLLCVLLVSGLVLVGIAGIRRVSGRTLGTKDLLERFAPSLVPIVLGYAIAHYVSLLVINGQALGFLLSDPRGDGSNLLGTAGWTIDYDVLSPEATWYLQVVALIGGHVAGLIAAHDVAVRTFRGRRTAARSQYWMLAVMVGFTSIGLWLLS